MADRRWRLLRGGSWYNSPGFCRSVCRGRDQPDDANVDVGFRVVCLAQGEQTLPLEETHD